MKHITIAIIAIAIITTSFMACKKNQEVNTLIELQHNTRATTTFDLTTIALPGSDYNVTRTDNANVWYVHNDNGAYKGNGTTWKQVSFNEVTWQIGQYEAAHPDNLNMQQPPQSAIHSWHFNCPLPCTLVKAGMNWSISPDACCPRKCY